MRCRRLEEDAAVFETWKTFWDLVAVSLHCEVLLLKFETPCWSSNTPGLHCSFGFSYSWIFAPHFVYCFHFHLFERAHGYIQTPSNLVPFFSSSNLLNCALQNLGKWLNTSGVVLLIKCKLCFRRESKMIFLLFDHLTVSELMSRPLSCLKVYHVLKQFQYIYIYFCIVYKSTIRLLLLNCHSLVFVW